MKSYRMDDGRYHHRMHQSWCKTADTCCERARLEHFDLIEDFESDAASIGTAAHTSFETCLAEHHEGQALTRSDTIEVFHDAFSAQIALPNFEWVKYDEPKARAFGEKCVGNWHDQVLPTLPHRALLEFKFAAPEEDPNADAPPVVLVDDAERLIELAGMIDYLPTEDGDVLRDWKTGRKHQEWEHKRWDLQATMYSYAAVRLGRLPPPVSAEAAIPFEFVVLHPHVQRYTVERGVPDWNWLGDKLTSYAILIEAELPTWPKSDNHALCSARWCPAFRAKQCKGGYYDEGWPHAA